MTHCTKQLHGLKKFCSQILILVIIAIYILFTSNSAVAQNRNPDHQEAGNFVLVKEKLKEMNKLLQQAIDDYKNNEIEEDSLKNCIDTIVHLKEDAMSEFPKAFGIEFWDWYMKFKIIDFGLNYAYEKAGEGETGADQLDRLKHVERMKKMLEYTLRAEARVDENNRSHYNMAKIKLKKMNELLQELIDDLINDNIGGDELQKRIAEIRDLKFEVLDQFPDFWDTSFRYWLIEFENLDNQLEDADFKAGYWQWSEKSVLVALENAKKTKEKLERWLIEYDDARMVEKVGSTWTPPTGTTRIAVVGTVRDEEVMITSRGTVGGTVTLEDKDGKQLTVAVPNEDGHFTINFGDVVAGTIGTTLVLTALDINGNTQTSTTVEYLPGKPSEVMGPPIITPPEIPYFENHQLYELEGQNFSEDAVVVITDEKEEEILQETLSSSTNRIMYFQDGPVGPAEVRVKNEFGSSDSLQIGIYELEINAGKMDLTRNETTNITAFYDGLPVGTKIIFTNMSRNVTVKPNTEAIVSGDDISFIVEDSLKQVSMTVKARRAGGWAVNYRLEFPEKH